MSVKQSKMELLAVSTDFARFETEGCTNEQSKKKGGQNFENNNGLF